MTLKGMLRISRPMAELNNLIKELFMTRRPWESLFCLGGSDDGVFVAVRKRARDYLRGFKDHDSIYDLDQLPRGRPRRARAGCPLFGLTAHTRNAWSPRMDRCLRCAELAAFMAIPSDPALACVYGMT